MLLHLLLICSSFTQDVEPAVRIVKKVIELQGKRETTHFLFDRGLAEFLGEVRA